MDGKDIAEALLITLREDINGACYLVWPDSPMVQVA